jgi:N-acetylmuramoyl-L-alanine amidase
LQLHLVAASSQDISNYSKYKKEYFNAIMHGNKSKEITTLKKLIYYANKLHKPTVKYKKELKLLTNSVSKVKISNKKLFHTKTNKIKFIQVDGNSIVLEFHHYINKKYIKFSEERHHGYFRDNFDIKGNYPGIDSLKLKMKSSNSLSKIVIYKKKANLIRLSLRAKNNPNTIYIISKNKLIIKVIEDSFRSKTSKRNINKKVSLMRSNHKKIIVIDAGHGGKDPGARGPRKRYEKVTVLNVAKRLEKILKSRGYIVYMTRKSDRYKTLKYRTRYANQKHADIFISIHANAVPKRKRNKIYGIETYYLSPARSERAKRVAAKENKADISSMSYSSKNVFLMTQNRAKITASNKLALDVQNNLLHKLKIKYKYIKDNGVRKGPFWILVGAQMPSILVEVGYISHPRESQRLYNSKYQQSLAIGIANGVDSYFIKNK